VRIKVAAVKLEVVDVPISEGLRVELEVVKTTGVAGARLGTDVLVNTKLETLAVDLSSVNTDTKPIRIDILQYKTGRDFR